MLVVSSVAAILGGVATASSSLMLGLCYSKEIRTGVFSSDSCCRRQQLRVYFLPSDSQHNWKKNVDPTLASPVVASGTEFRVDGFYVTCFSVEANVRTGT